MTSVMRYGFKDVARSDFKNGHSNGRSKNTNQRSVIITAFAVILFIVVLAASKGSLICHIQKFREASAHFCQSTWDNFLDTVGENYVTLWVYVPMAIFVVIYWTLGGIYTLLDVFNKPAALRRYKVQPGTNEPVDTKKLLKAILWVLINQLVIYLTLSNVIVHITLWRGYPPFRMLPPLHRVLLDIVICIGLDDIGFYYLHRLFHSKYLYKHIHKKHHEWTAPIAITALYMHPFELIIVNITPLVIGIVVMGSHVFTVYMWYIGAIIIALHTHSGYHLPFLPPPEFHDFHHLKITQCYSTIGLLDRLHGTDKLFRASPMYQQNIFTVRLTPVREIFSSSQ